MFASNSHVLSCDSPTLSVFLHVEALMLTLRPLPARPSPPSPGSFSGSSHFAEEAPSLRPGPRVHGPAVLVLSQPRGLPGVLHSTRQLLSLLRRLHDTVFNSLLSPVWCCLAPPRPSVSSLESAPQCKTEALLRTSDSAALGH